MRYALRIATMLAAIGLLGLMFAIMPRGYDADLSHIGKGRQAAVLVHDPGFVASMDLMESVDRIRGELEPRMLFLLADLNTLQGQQFAKRQSVTFGTLVLFDAEGRHLASHSGNAGETELRQFLQAHHR